MDQDVPVVAARYEGIWGPDDPHANFKRDVAERTRLDPMPTFRELSEATGVPLGALVRYALVRWAAEGSEGLLALGPRTIAHMWAQVEEAERAGTDAGRLEAYEALRGMLSWLRAPLADPDEDG